MQRVVRCLNPQVPVRGICFSQFHGLGDHWASIKRSDGLQVGEILCWNIPIRPLNAPHLAAMRPSSIRQRQTSRGCFWRTFFFVPRDQNKNDKERKTDKVSRKNGHLSKRTDVSRDKLSVSDGNGSCHLSGLQFRGKGSCSFVRLYLWSRAGIPVGAGRMRAALRRYQHARSTAKNIVAIHLCAYSELPKTQI